MTERMTDVRLVEIEREEREDCRLAHWATHGRAWDTCYFARCVNSRTLITEVHALREHVTVLARVVKRHEQWFQFRQFIGLQRRA